MVSWLSKKQKTIADSTCATEYMAASEASRKLVWLCTLLVNSTLNNNKLHPFYVITLLLCYFAVIRLSTTR